MNSENKPESQFLNALIEDNQEEISRIFPGQEFILIEISSENSDENQEIVETTSALTVEIDGFLALVAFTSHQYVELFSEESEMFEENETIPCFVLTGAELVSLLPPKLGILFNPDSDDCFLMDPEVLQSFKASMHLDIE